MNSRILKRKYKNMLKSAKLDKKMKKIYLDYASTTPIDPMILKSMLPYFDMKYSNPSSMYESGRMAKSVIDESRKKIAKCINCKPDEIIFTGSGTEADNLAILGIARAYRDRGNHIIISSIEHKAISEPAKQLEKEGFEITVLPVDKTGTIDIKQVIASIKKETILISIMYANNEIGTVEPIKELAIAIKNHRGVNTFPLLHTDACQAAGYLSIDTDRLGIDLMTLNSSKIYGPKGIGMLYKRSGIKINPIISGGEQERNLRAGTENIALIHGFADALVKAYDNKEKEVSPEVIQQIIRWVYLQVIDNYWMEHLTVLEDLRQGIGLRGYAQRDPLVEYKKEAFMLFERLVQNIDTDAIDRILKVQVKMADQVQQKTPLQQAAQYAQYLSGRQTAVTPQGESKIQQEANKVRSSVHPVVSGEKKIGRNDPCPCGAINPNTGKPYKYKKCGMINALYHKLN